MPFESGVSTGPPEQQRFTISFYLTAMLFIVFDIEIVFLYPLAVELDALAWFGFFGLLFFIAILALALLPLPLPEPPAFMLAAVPAAPGSASPSTCAVQPAASAAPSEVASATFASRCRALMRAIAR